MNAQTALAHCASAVQPSALQTTSPSVLITGATGAIGPRVVARFINAGWRVRLLLRQPTLTQNQPPAVEVVPGDITDPTAVHAAVCGCQYIVHMAALLHILDPSPTLRARYEAVNVEGTRHLVQAALAHRVDRLLFFSTIAVYGASQGAILDETSPPCPDTLYGQTKLAAERLVLAAQRADGQPLGVVLRLAAVYGARVKGNYQRLLQAIAQGRFFAIGAGQNRRTLIYDQDVAQAAFLALIHPAAAGQIYNVTDGHFHTLRQIVSAISGALGRKPTRLAVPLALARWSVAFLESSLHAVGRKSPIGRATIAKYIEDIAVDGHRLQTDLGFAPQFDLVAGWQDVVQTLQRGSDP